MAENENAQKDTELLKKFPWQRTVLVLAAVIGTLYGSISFYWTSQQQKDNEREAERVGNLRKEYKDMQQQLQDCQTGRSGDLKTMLNTEWAIKLSKDTTATARKIAETLIKTIQDKNK